MSDITVNYKGAAIAALDASGTKTLLTQGKYCEDDIEIVYVKPAGGGFTAAELLACTKPEGDIVENSVTNYYGQLSHNTAITSFTSGSITKLNLAKGFQGCTALVSCKITAAITTLETNQWDGCSSLQTLELPYLTANFPTYGAASCFQLVLADIGSAAQLIANGFRNASRLATLILRKTSVMSLQNVSAFQGTPFASGGTGGTIYIPKSLYDHLGDGTSSDYKAATNWSALNGYGTVTWAKIEGSAYEL